MSVTSSWLRRPTVIARSMELAPWRAALPNVQASERTRRGVVMTVSTAFNARMQRTAFPLLILFLAWCVGFQATASAMGVRCTGAGKAPADHAMPAGMDHHRHAAAAMVMDSASASPHAHHGASQGLAAGAGAKTGMSALGCQCDCSCTSVGCLGSGPGVASQCATRSFQATAVAFPRPGPDAGLRSAHGPDLNRPPSKS